jgi:hypothetical protein
VAFHRQPRNPPTATVLKRAHVSMPKILYVTIDSDGTPDSLIDREDMREDTIYGVYELKSVSKVKIEVTLV